MNLRSLGLACIALWVIGGCTVYGGDFSMVSPNNIPDGYRVIARNVEGEACTVHVLLFPIRLEPLHIEEAMQRALESVPDGNVLINARMFGYFFVVPFYSKICARVVGDVGILE